MSVILTGGGAVEVDAFPVGLGTLSVEWGFLEPWAISIDAGLESVRTRPVVGTSASVDVLLQWATLSARRSFFAHGLDGFHLSLGARLVRLSASSHGLSTDGSADVLVPAVAAHFDWRLTLWGGFFFLARLNLDARLVPQEFLVNGSVVLRVPPYGVGAEVGVGWNFL